MTELFSLRLYQNITFLSSLECQLSWSITWVWATCNKPSAGSWLGCPNNATSTPIWHFPLHWFFCLSDPGWTHAPITALAVGSVVWGIPVSRCSVYVRMAGKDRPVMCPTARLTVASLSGDSVKPVPNDANANQGGKVSPSLCRNRA